MISEKPCGPGLFSALVPQSVADALTLPAAESPDEIIRTFQVAITSLPESARVVLVFDALNQLDADDRAETLVWLPERLPANVRVLCSVATGPQRAPRVLTAFGERDVVAVPMEPLTRDERRDLVKAVPKLVAKTLDDRPDRRPAGQPRDREPPLPDDRPGRAARLWLVREPEHADRPAPAHGRCPDDALRAGLRAPRERIRREPGAEVLSLLACARRGLSGPELVD